MTPDAAGLSCPETLPCQLVVAGPFGDRLIPSQPICLMPHIPLSHVHMPYIVHYIMTPECVYSLTLKAPTHCKHSTLVSRAMLCELDLYHVWHDVQMVM